MKKVLFVSMMMFASLLFIINVANAQEMLVRPNEMLSAGTSGEQQGAGEFMLTVPATQEGIGEMIPADAGPVTWEMNFKEHTAQFTNGRGLCGYCSLFERAGFP